jgi:UDP-N-acetylmuramyl pentapeptide phosphotransferase/UDP-N-acetylglucosamine-1-phosphate transferase
MLSMTSIIAMVIGLSFCIVMFGIPILRRALVSKGIYDNPNARSSHSLPTPRGGGIIVMISITIGLVTLWWGGVILPDGLIVALAISCGLGLISWMDDLWSISALVRLVYQVMAIGGILYLDPGLAINALPFFPEWGAFLIIAAAWVWCVNLYNFMDGIDGMTAVETVSICTGLALLTLTGILSNDLLPPLAVIGAAALAFLYWNWSPAKIFLGDVGSIPLGFLLGWFVLKAVNEGAWLAAIIILGYYLADATITLIRRAFRGTPVWQAHREHFYQMPVPRNVPHNQIMYRIIAINIILILAAVWVVPINHWAALCASSFFILILLRNLSQLGK